MKIIIKNIETKIEKVEKTKYLFSFKTTENLNVKKPIPLSNFKEYLKKYEPNFAKKINISIDDEKWSIHRLGSRKKLNRKNETLSYFRFNSIKGNNDDTFFLSINNRTGGVELVPSFYEGTSDCDTGELYLLLDCTGFSIVVTRSNGDIFEGADIEYELGMSKYFWEVADLIIEHYGKTTEIKKMMKSAAKISTEHTMEVDPYGYLKNNKIK